MKQELLDFILANVTDTMKLKTYEHFPNGTPVTKFWHASKEKTYAVIRDLFDNNLDGHMPNDFKHPTHIDSWEVVPFEPITS